MRAACAAMQRSPADGGRDARRVAGSNQAFSHTHLRESDYIRTGLSLLGKLRTSVVTRHYPHTHYYDYYCALSSRLQGRRVVSGGKQKQRMDKRGVHVSWAGALYGSRPGRWGGSNLRLTSIADRLLEGGGGLALRRRRAG